MKPTRHLCLALLILISAFSTWVYADVPQRMNYQGKITTPGGALVDTTIQMVFSIYSSPTTGSALWTETHPAVAVQKGIFSVVLGMQNPLDSDDFYWQDSLYLGVKVGADPEMTPRKQIVSSGYALTDGDWYEWNNDLYRYEGDVYIGPPIYRTADMRGEDYQGWAKLEVAGDYECAIYGYLYPYIYPAGGAQPEFYGVIGDVWNEATGYNYGVLGYAGSPGTNYGVYGTTEGGGETGGCYGVWGEAYGIGFNCGLYGVVDGPEANFGAWTMAGMSEREYVPETNIGIMAAADNATENFGIYAYAPIQEGSAAGYFDGDIYVEGSIYQPLASVQMDHPLDPENKYLQHSLVESPDMMNVHNGNVILDANGQATVQLPTYFEALNKDFRYQLTCIGGFAPVYVAQEISGNQFVIAGGEPGMKVSWQVTGIRNDPFAEANRLQVEIDKPVKHQGKYLHPEAYGMTKEYGTRYELHMKLEEQQQLTKEQAEPKRLLQERRLKVNR